jgi:hypothetical protein
MVKFLTRVSLLAGGERRSAVRRTRRGKKKKRSSSRLGTWQSSSLPRDKARRLFRKPRPALSGRNSWHVAPLHRCTVAWITVRTSSEAGPCESDLAVFLRRSGIANATRSLPLNDRIRHAEFDQRHPIRATDFLSCRFHALVLARERTLAGVAILRSRDRSLAPFLVRKVNGILFRCIRGSAGGFRATVT